MLQCWMNVIHIVTAVTFAVLWINNALNINKNRRSLNWSILSTFLFQKHANESFQNHHFRTLHWPQLKSHSLARKQKLFLLNSHSKRNHQLSLLIFFQKPLQIIQLRLLLNLVRQINEPHRNKVQDQLRQYLRLLNNLKLREISILKLLLLSTTSFQSLIEKIWRQSKMM